MKLRFFNSIEQYERCLECTHAVFETVDIIRENGWYKGDTLTRCKKPATAVNRFFRTVDRLPAYAGWRECILEAIENGCYKQNDFTMGDGTRNAGASWAWELEEISDGLWYMFLNVRV